ncbi:HD domain-containing protein [Citroniella saccharovorans]|uniref:HD domain-containing protein n=1 Tax=Citroniella saccharovorans TaxID=2053367 RepID=A0AAW9MVT1_9FIRM|nr:HD domain-containing protein [Citroniella saccharovorans]MEB3429873.1 HD domain-containing protein [Citroniella saccharovorans]
MLDIDLKNTNIIFSNKTYQKHLKEIENFEKERYFCRHDLSHFLDVARIFTILIQREKLDIKFDIIYSAALLHDIGRALEYKDGISHDLASIQIAKELLKETSFTKEEIKIIISLIENHRNKTYTNSLESLFYKADKLSRECFNCKAIGLCKWSDEKKNLKIKI